jgi:hypothetical protein
MYPESKPAKWLFPQEKSTLKTPGKGTLTLIPLYENRLRFNGTPQPAAQAWGKE